ncbi:f-box domain-containing protein [Colletotrichum incanum]|uniref:F-box domain-containing protein n=1 Tax=Colletotrichum incanum TaxID=1573173 RepID=A0A161W5F6_COLIC|nr:f-box domain-containing protein [Colletotrichum incanum]
MDAPETDVTKTGDSATVMEVAPTPRTYLVTLPRELILQVIKICHESSPARAGYLWNGAYRETVVKLSRVNKCLRTLSIPYIFENMKLLANEDSLDARLQAIEGNALIINAARYLSLETHGSERAPSRWDFLNPSPPINPCGAPTTALLVKVLSKMNLEELQLKFIWGNRSMERLFRKELVTQQVTLQSVKVLTYPTSITVNFLPAVFHNLRVLSLKTHGSPKKTSGLKVIAPKLNSLDTLELDKGQWKLTDVEEVAELFPSIPRLLIAGELRSTRVSVCYSHQARSVPLTPWLSTRRQSLTREGGANNAKQSLIPVSKQMANLKNLALTEDPVVFPRPGLMDSALMCEIELLREYHPLREDSHDNALEFFRQCPQLEELLLKRDYEAKVYHPLKQGNKVIDVEETIEDLDFGWPVISHAGRSP